MPILNIGSINVDHVYNVPYFAHPGETLACLSYARGLGGKGLNQSIALQRAGATVHHVGAIGQDDDWCRKQLGTMGLSLDWIAGVECDTGHALIQVEESGQNCILLHGGANQAIAPDWVDQALAAHPECNWVLLQNEINDIEAWFAKALRSKRRLAFNPAPCTPDLAKLPLEQLGLLLVNEVEVQQLGGYSNFDTALNALGARCPNTLVILTLGPGGVRAVWRGERFAQPAIPVHVLDTTAAGDTFAGYLLAGLDTGDNLINILAYACQAAAITVTRTGAASSIPWRHETCDPRLL